MIYREYLVMRKALAWFAAIVVAIMLIVPYARDGIAVSFDNAIGFAEITNGAGWLAAIFASIFGVALGNGSREAARVLWVLPTARRQLALQVIAVDLVGTTVAFACVFAFFPAVAWLRFRMNLHGALSATDIAMTLAMVYGTYGWSALVGMLGRRMAYGGIIALPLLMIWMIFALSQIPVATILQSLAIANPFAVYNAGLHAMSPLQWLGTAWTTPVLVAIAVVTCGLAVALWQRAEVIT
jgi:hypothetical protein